MEYIDLFNGYFDKGFKIEADDYLEIDGSLTREAILRFKNKPSSFCKNYKRLYAEYKKSPDIEKLAKGILYHYTYPRID